MKRNLLIASCLLLLKIGFSQGKINGTEFVEPGDIFLSAKLPFSSVRIIDARFDSTKLGYVKTTIGHDYKKIVTKQSLSKTLEEYVNNRLSGNFNQPARENLLIVIKKLWLQQATQDEVNNKKMSMTSGPSGEGFGMCTPAFDVYVQKDSVYFPLLKIDTTLFTLKKLNKGDDYLLSYALENCLKRIASYDLSKINNRKPLSWQTIAEYNNRRFNYPRFTNDTLTKGIYLTFKDFLNNKPLIKKFITQSGKITDELYVEENGNQTLLKNFWGFCDGERNYINIGYNFFELAMESNTYELWGSKLITERTSQHYVPGSYGTNTINTKKTKLNYKPLQLDMETGKVY